MKKVWFPLAALLAALLYFYAQTPATLGPMAKHSAVATPPAATPSALDTDAILAQAFAQQRSDLQVSGQGQVIKLLADDLRGRRHQRFILRLANGQTLLVAHNIDLAPRIDQLKIGDTVQFYGEYEWTHQGGVLHWTHHDPRGQHAAGWLQHQGRRYQ